jgi:HD superfamily phosphodiesterase
MIPELNAFCKESLQKYDGSHDLFHAQKVACNAFKISKHEAYLSVIAAFLHDTCDPKYVSKQYGLNRIKEFLSIFLCIDEIDDICDAIQHTSFSKLKRNGLPLCSTSRSFKIWRNLADSDMLEALGIIGVFRTLMYQGFKQKNINEAIYYISNNIIECDKYITSKELENEVQRRKKNTAKFLQEYDKHAKVQDIANKIMHEGTLKTSFLKTIEKHMKELQAIGWLWIELAKDIAYAVQSVDTG